MTQWEKYIEYLKKWPEDHKDEMFAGMSPVGFDEWENDEEVTEDTNRVIICKITWRIQDIVDNFRDEYGREPTQKEINAIYECYKAEECEEVSISRGWEYIYEATEEAMPIGDDEDVSD